MRQFQGVQELIFPFQLGDTEIVDFLLHRNALGDISQNPKTPKPPNPKTPKPQNP